MATFVLVHGGFHGGWCYSMVALRLRASGHDVYTPTLSGLGERAHLATQAINLSTHVQDVIQTLESHDLHDVILCGHSYAGMVITGVAGRVAERVRTLFYLDACVPDDGQSLCDIGGPDWTLAVLQAAGATGTLMPSPGARAFGVDKAFCEWVDKQCTPHPIACFIQRLKFTGCEGLIERRTYVLCERYRSANHKTYEKVRALPGWKVVSVDRGHDLMIDDPDLLSTLLLEELNR